MRLRSLFKRFRLVFPVFGILLGSCSGSLNLPTMNRKNALPDGYSSLSVGLVASSLYFGEPVVETSGAGFCFNISIDGISITFLSTGTSKVVYLNSATYSLLAPYVLNASDFTFTSGALNFGEGYNTDCVIYFNKPYTVTNLYSRFNEVSGEVGVPSGDLYLTGYSAGYSAGDSVGYSNGYAEGNSVGYGSGYADGYSYASSIPTVVTFSVPSDTTYNWNLVLSGGAQGTISLTSSNSSYSVTCDPSYTDWYSWICTIPSVSSGYYRYSYSDSLGNSLTLDTTYEDDVTGRDLGLFLPYWVSWIKIECVYSTSSGPWSYDDYCVFHYSRDADDFELIKIGLSTQFYHAGYDDGYDSGFTAGYDSGYYDMSVVADSQIAQTSGEAYNDGRASVGTEETAITNLLGSLVSVPISVLNGLMPLAIWNTPIISILVTLMVVALVLWLVRVLI